MSYLSLSSLVVIASSTLAVHAQESLPATSEPQPVEVKTEEPRKMSYDRSLAVGYAHFFDASFGSGTSGSVSENRSYAKYAIEEVGTDATKLGISFNYSGTWYDFEGASPLDPAPGAAPWGAVTSLLISPSLSVKCDAHWNAFARVFVGCSGENSADVWDSATAGGAVGASYSFNQDFTLGLGVLATSQIEDNILVIPLLIVDWEIYEDLRVTNVAGPAAYPTGNGLELAWRVNDSFELAFGGRWEIDRFRLDDDASNPDGVGQDEGLPLWVRGTWNINKSIRLDLLGGVRVGSEFHLYDRNGNGLTSTDVDAQPFLGIFFSTSF